MLLGARNNAPIAPGDMLDPRSSQTGQNLITVYNMKSKVHMEQIANFFSLVDSLMHFLPLVNFGVIISRFFLFSEIRMSKLCNEEKYCFDGWCFVWSLKWLYKYLIRVYVKVKMKCHDLTVWDVKVYDSKIRLFILKILLMYYRIKSYGSTQISSNFIRWLWHHATLVLHMC